MFGPSFQLKVRLFCCDASSSWSTHMNMVKIEILVQWPVLLTRYVRKLDL